MKIQHFTICIALVFFLSAGAWAQDALDLPMNREGSGTAWQPDSTPMYAKGFMLGGWSMMAGELAFGGYDYQGSRRGAGQVFSTNWAMLMAEHELLGGEPILVLQLYDRIIPNQSYGTLSLLGIAVGIVLILEASLRFSRGYV